MPISHASSDKSAVLRVNRTLHTHPERVCDELFTSHPFFDPRDLVQVKYEMLRRVTREGWAVTQAAATFGLSRPSFYQAQRGFGKHGLWGLVPQRRGPRHAHKLTGEVMSCVETIVSDQPTLSMSALAGLIAVRCGVVVHPRTLVRHLAASKKKLLWSALPARSKLLHS